jgi:hypothetical protein
MESRKLNFLKFLFLMAALWNLIGVGFGYFNSAYTFQLFFGRELSDPLIYGIYQGAWGTTFVYFFGYLIVAYNPIKHPGIVIVGGIGKFGYAASLLKLYLSGIANPVVLVVVVGDSIFLLFFFYYFVQLRMARKSIF